jgi:hypothetical protein
VKAYRGNILRGLSDVETFLLLLRNDILVQLTHNDGWQQLPSDTADVMLSYLSQPVSKTTPSIMVDIDKQINFQRGLNTPGSCRGMQSVSWNSLVLDALDLYTDI